MTPSASALATGAGLQAAVVVYSLGRPTAAVWIAAPCVAFFIWQWTRKRSKVALVVLNAILLSIPVRVYYYRSGGNANSGHRGSESPPGEGSADSGGIAVDNTFPGVILFPDVQRHATIVPPLPAMRGKLFDTAHPQPLTIPFFGSYWYYKWPQWTLPKNAITMHGDADKKRFRSTDGHKLLMEAHQNLGIFIDTSCCKSIEIGIRNADRFPGSVRVTLRLLNSSAKASLGLGSVPVAQEPAQTLAFRIPSSPPLERFDEFSVAFDLSWVRHEHSAAVAIERFVLVPR